MKLPSAGYKLPHDILHEIFSMPGICLIDDETFENTSPHSHSIFPDRSTGISVALVCKTWLQVATPLLYETIIVNSSVQSRALWSTLRKIPTLGMHIKRIRLHRGLGKSIGQALGFCSHIQDLFISLVLSSKDDVSGVCAALPLLSPRRLILHDPECNYSTNQNITKLSQALCRSILTWKTLESFHFPYDSMNMPWIGLVLDHKHASRIGLFRNVILDTKHLTTLHIPCVNYQTFLLFDIVSRQLNHPQAIYVHAPLTPAFIYSPFFAPISGSSFMRQALRFPLPGPLTVRLYASLAEVSDPSALYWQT